MTVTQFLQAGIALLAAGTPWIVLRVVGRPSRHLTLATAILAVPLVGLALSVSPPSLALTISVLATFVVLAGFGVADLNAIDGATRSARELISPERVANLQPRSVASFVSPGSRLLPYAVAVIGLSIFVLRWLAPVADRRPFQGLGLALAALIFLALYDRWIYEEVCGPQAEGGRPEVETARRVRSIRKMQIALVAGLLLAADIVIGLDWTRHPQVALACSLAAGLLGVVGCAKAIASGFTGRRYQMARE